MRSMPADQPRRRRVNVGSRGRVTLVLLAVALFVLLTSLRGIAGFYTDLLWFDSLGFRGVFTGVLGAKITLAVIFSGAFFALLWINLLIADRLGPRFRPSGPEEEVIERYHELIGNRTGLVRLAIALLFGIIAGVGQAGHWHDWLLFRNAQDFGITDEQFGRDIGFYVFKLPFLTFVVDWLFASLIIILIVTAVAHYVNGGIRVQGIAQRVTPQVKAHLSVLLGLLAVVRAAGYYLQQFELTLSSRGTVDGATYTDVRAQLPALRLLLIISGVAVLLFIVNIWRRGWVLPILAVGLWAFVALVVGGIYPAFVQRFRVEPSESSKERPYIERNITATRAAYGLGDVEVKTFAASGDLDASDLEANAATVANIRLWDPDTIRKAYARLQRVRDQYRVLDVDVDRYEIDGEIRQVLVAARELDQSQLPQRSWEASHLTYTNGHGLIAAQSNAKDSNGRPVFLSRDVPMRTSVPELEVEQPAIYIGEGLDGYVMVNTERREIAFQNEEETEFTTYDGADGIGIGSIVRRAAFALRFADWNAFISGNITDESKILIVRDVRERVELVAPFLHFDGDPYVVNIDGRIKYIVDAYTTTNRYPYSQQAETDDQDTRTSGLRHSFNYVRNSVKAVVDAYDGSVTLHIVDESDPLIRAYKDAFPQLFADEPPSDELRAHFRYPEDLFRLQTTMWARYHIDDADDFYTGSDAWNVAQAPGAESTTTQATNADGTTTTTTSRQRMVPYYLQMRLPGEEREEFLILRPFVPVARGDQGSQLLTAFMVGKSDIDSYGKLETFVMPRSNLPDGPEIVAASIRNDPEVAELETFLDQRGSNLEFGNLVLVPIEQSLLFVQPIYVESEATDIPELERVIVSFQGEVVLGNTLQEALTGLFGSAPDTGEEEDTTPDDGEEPEDVLTVDELLTLAAEALAAADAALAEGDLGEYQTQVEAAQGYIAQAQAAGGGGGDTSSSSTTTTAPPDEDEDEEAA